MDVDVEQPPLNQSAGGDNLPNVALPYDPLPEEHPDGSIYEE
jgi:hypothetical protein